MPESDTLAATRAHIAEDSPAVLWIERGEQLWHRPAGPRGASLETCDLGLGPGVVAGAFAALPRWFADAGQVMDLEQRLMWCMQHLQGLSAEDAARDHFGRGAQLSALEALSAWIASQSQGLPVAVRAELPEERRMLALGRYLFNYRAGSHDFSCASCHSEDNRRIRLQKLPNLTRPAEAQAVFGTWPAYRMTDGELRTLSWRLQDCLRQQRFPEVRYGSEAITALSIYLAWSARGGPIDAPSIKR